MIFFYILWQVGKGPDALSLAETLEVKDGRRSLFRAFALKKKNGRRRGPPLGLQVRVKKSESFGV